MNCNRAKLIAHLRIEARRLRRSIVTGAIDPLFHPGGMLSAADIIAALYFHFMRVDPANPQWEERDIFILSKGHVGYVLYAALARRGFFPQELLERYMRRGGIFGTHPGRQVQGVDVTTGSMGHGLAVGVGMALAGRYDNKLYKVYVMLGDGELQEGSCWEALMAAAHYKLHRLVAIVDRNKLQGKAGPTEDVMAIEPLRDKLESFGWSVQTIDGNDMTEVYDALNALPFDSCKPSAIIASTIKGKGVSFLEHTARSHVTALTETEIQQGLDELGDE